MHARKRGKKKNRRYGAPKSNIRTDRADVLEGPDFRLERDGRFIHMSVTRTPEEQGALIEAMANSVDEKQTDLERCAAAVEARLSEFDTFSILSALSLQNHLADPETCQEFSHPGKSVVAEYATLLALKHPYSEGTRLFPDGAILGPTLSELQTEIEHIVQSTFWLQMARDARRAVQAGMASDPASTFRQLQFIMRMHELTLRNPAYEHHLHEVLEGLFRPFEAALVASIGFSVDDVIRLTDAIPQRINRLFVERLDRARESLQKMERVVRNARKQPRCGPDAHDIGLGMDEEVLKHAAIIHELARRPPKEAIHSLRALATEWVFFGSASICSFTVEDLAHNAGVSTECTAAFASALAIEFGDVKTDFVEPSPTHPLRTHPLVHHADRYLCPAPMLLKWPIQPAFEATLKGIGGPLWERYQKHRHDWLLNTAVKLLQRTMPTAEFATNLLYNVDDDRAKQAELDALGRYDSLVFLIEAKGADVTEPARRGAPDRLRRDLEEVIAKSHAQAVRAKAYLSGRPEARFRRAHGGPDVLIPVDTVRDVILISVSLAPLGHLTGLLHADSALGFFRDGEYSWVVSLYDLMVITDVIDLPPVFPHYAKRRVHTARLGLLKALDELDIFSYYLAEGLYLDDVASALRSGGQNASFGLMSYTSGFDDYYAYVTGVRRTPAPKPTPRLNPELRAILERLERSGFPGRLDAAMAILDLDDRGRKDFLRHVKKARQISQRERRASNASLQAAHDGGWGLTYMCDCELERLGETLQSYCARKQREEGVRTWIGFAELVGRQPQIISVTVLRDDTPA
jgi:hypothetical protein